MPTKATTNRKRSAEICPHPPHLLNKRYWEEAKAGKARIPNKSGKLPKFINNFYYFLRSSKYLYKKGNSL